MRRPIKVCLVASAGGHWAQLLRVAEASRAYPRFFVTTNRNAEDDLSPPSKLHIVQHANRMYFYVPAHVEQFRIEVATPYVAEQAKLLVWDPSGKEAAKAETFEKVPAVATLRPTKAQRGKVWSFQMLPTYSANLKWDPQLPPYLAESPKAMLVPAHMASGLGRNAK